MADPGLMERRDDENRFRVLPEPPRREDLVETVDVSREADFETESEERARFLRNAGGI